MKRILKRLCSMAAVAICIGVTGCTTTDQQDSGSPRVSRRAAPVQRPTTDPQPATVRFSTFSTVVMKPVTIAPEYANGGASQRALSRINGELIKNMRQPFPNLQESGSAADTGAHTLLIEPRIEGLRFISGGARFWVGGMAGSSAVRMKVTFKDGTSGAIIAAPEFYRQSNAWEGGMSVGASDNAMLRQITEDVAGYAALNR